MIGTFREVVQFDRGKIHSNRPFERTRSLDKPPPLLQATVESLKAEHELTGNQISKYLTEMFKMFPNMEVKYGYLGMECNQLFEATYNHNGGKTCRLCN